MIAHRLAAAPLVPDAPTARALARRELADPVYGQGRPGLWSRLLRAIGDLVDRVRLPEGSSPLHLLALLALLIVLAVGLFLAVRATGRVRRATAARHDALASTRTADELRAAADAAASAGAWDLAVTERFRALVKAAQARDLVDSSPGLTAAEAAAAAGGHFPELAARWAAAGERFDAVVYGHQSAGAGDDAALRSLDAEVARSQPRAGQLVAPS